MEPVKGGVMSYMEWEVRQDGTAFDIMNESGAFCTCDNEKDAKRIVHCVNNYDGLVQTCKEMMIEFLAYQDKHPNLSAKTVVAWEQALAKTERKKAIPHKTKAKKEDWNSREADQVALDDFNESDTRGDVGL